MSLEDPLSQRPFAKTIERAVRKINSLSWRSLPYYEPRYVDYHPCPHRWLKTHREHEPQKRIRFNYKEFAERIDKLSNPLMRRLLWLWISHGSTLSPKRRARLRKMLKNYGYTDEDLNKHVLKAGISSAKRVNVGDDEDEFEEYDSETIGTGDDENGTVRGSGKRRFGKENGRQKSTIKHGEKYEHNRKGIGKGKMAGEGARETKGKKKGGGKRKVKGGGKGKSGGGKRRGGKGGKASRRQKGGGDEGKRDRDDDSGRSFLKSGKIAKGWPNRIATILFQLLMTAFSKTPDEAYLSRAREYFDVQAFLILQICSSALQKDVPDFLSSCPLDQMLVLACLNIVTFIGKAVVTPAQAIPDSEVDKLLLLHGSEPKLDTDKRKQPKRKGKGKGKKGKGKEKKGESKGKKGKSKGKKAKGKGKKRKDNEKNKHNTGEKNEREVPVPIPLILSESDTNQVNWAEKKLPIHPQGVSGREEVEEDAVDTFMRTLIWYTPSVPEFVYNGNRKFPSDIEIICDQRDTTWAITSLPVIVPDKLFPEPVPPYFENFRPTAYCYNDVGDEPSPWYIMNDEAFYKPGHQVADMAAIVEHIEMLLDILKKMHSMPNLSMKALLEMLNELTVAVKTVKEEITAEDRLMDDKRTIVLKKIFTHYFGNNFRDYNEDTADVTETLCRRFAVIIRQIYRHTGYTLWNLQHRNLTKLDIPKTVEEMPDDPIMLHAWDAWLAWLTKVCVSGSDWAEWLVECESELLEMAKNVKPKVFHRWLSQSKNVAEDWCVFRGEEEENGRYYAGKALTLEQVLNREIPVRYVNEWYPEGGRDSLMVPSSN